MIDVNVTLYTKSIHGCKDTLKRLEYVKFQPPIAGFISSNQNLCKDAQVQFINSSHDLFISHQLRLMILDHENNYIGCVDLYDFDPVHLRAGVGILIGEELRNKGFAKESLELLKQYSFDELKLNQLHCVIGVNNMKSIQLFKGCGFNKPGQLRSWLKRKNGWEDVIYFQCFPTST